MAHCRGRSAENVDNMDRMFWRLDIRTLFRKQNGNSSGDRHNALPSATTGTAYSISLSASGGQPPYRWNIAHGALPSGVQLSDSTGALSGTRSASGQFPFEIELSGQNGSSVQQDLTLIVTSSTSTPSSSDCDSKPPSAFACGPGDAWRTMAHSDGSIRSRSAADSTNVKIGLKNEEVPKPEPIPI